MTKSINFPIRMPNKLRQDSADNDALCSAIEESLNDIKEGKIINGDEFFKFLDNEITRLNEMVRK